MNLKEFYFKNNYAVVRNLTNPLPLRNLPQLYVEGHEDYDYKDSIQIQFTDQEHQVKGSYSRTNHPFYKGLHEKTHKVLENILETKLTPTYYFDRVYYSGQELTPHTDWHGCEVSVTLQIETTLRSAWDFYVEGTPIKMKNGDAVIYNGTLAKHWRKPMEGNSKDYHHQIFLHYVIHNSPSYFTVLKKKQQMIEKGYPLPYF